MSKIFYSANGNAFKATNKQIIERMTETVTNNQTLNDNSLDLVGNLEIKGDIKARRYLDVNGNQMSFADPKGTYTIGILNEQQGQIGIGVANPKSQLHVGKSLQVDENIKLNETGKVCFGENCFNKETLEGLKSSKESNLITITSGGERKHIQTPDGNLRITSEGILFGGNNKTGKEVNSAQITAGIHEPNSLNIVGMSMDNLPSSRKVDVWAEAGVTLRGPTTVWGKLESQTLNTKGNITVGGNLESQTLNTKGNITVGGNLESQTQNTKGTANIGGDLNVNGRIMSKSTDFQLFNLERSGNKPHPGRALVHDAGDVLSINFAGDYKGGTKVTGNLNVTGDLAKVGGNNWIFHTPDDKRRSLYIAPSTAYGNTQWNWKNYVEIDANGKLTNLNGNNQIKDTRGIKDGWENGKLTPKGYLAKGMGKYTEFKTNHDGLTGGFYVVETIVPWNDQSGGKIKQIAYGDDGIFYRTGVANSDSWDGNFKKVQLA